MTLILFREDIRFNSTEVIRSAIILGIIEDRIILIKLSLKAIMAKSSKMNTYNALVKPSYKVNLFSIVMVEPNNILKIRSNIFAFFIDRGFRNLYTNHVIIKP